MYPIFKKYMFISLILAAMSAGAATAAFACACGCGVFGVGSRWTMPTESGLNMYLQYSFMDQDKNWIGSSSASADLNGDKEIRTSFFTLGAQYMINRKWGVMAEIPYWDRYLKTTGDSGDIVSAEHHTLSDISLMGMYTGFSPDMSTGIQFGFKLPTGPYNLPGFDPDTQPGYGSISTLLGGYHMGQETGWGWWVQGLWRHALYTNSNDYHPGDSFNLAVGAHYDRFAPKTGIVPTLQLIESIRGRDGGSAGDPDNTGFQRLFVTPGVEVDICRTIKFFGDVQLPVYTHANAVTGQLVAPWLINTAVSYSF